jgi:hypothetical protein
VRAAKQSDSPSGFDREVGPHVRSRLTRLEQHEADVRQLTHERWQRKIRIALAQPDAVEDPEFPGCVW